MSELNFLLRKVAAEREKEEKEFRVMHLESSVIPHVEHELKTVKELGLEYVAVENRLNSLYREFKYLTGREYQH